jgi:hypothetical protein
VDFQYRNLYALEKNTRPKTLRYRNNRILLSAFSCYKKHAVRLVPPLVYRLIIVMKALRVQSSVLPEALDQLRDPSLKPLIQGESV